jgi:GAF domain-containing protein
MIDLLDSSAPAAHPDPSPAEAVAALTRDLFVATADDLVARRCAFAELLRNVREILGMDIAFVSEFIGDKRVFHHVSLSEQSSARLSDGDADVRGDSYCQRVVDGRLPGVITDTATLCAAADLAITRTLGIGAFMSVPVVLDDGTVYGTVCCISHSPRTALGNRQIDALRCVATFVAREVERHRRV